MKTFPPPFPAFDAFPATSPLANLKLLKVVAREEKGVAGKGDNEEDEDEDDETKVAEEKSSGFKIPKVGVKFAGRMR